MKLFITGNFSLTPVLKFWQFEGIAQKKKTKL
jgi:hypothetical protein